MNQQSVTSRPTGFVTLVIQSRGLRAPTAEGATVDVGCSGCRHVSAGRCRYTIVFERKRPDLYSNKIICSTNSLQSATLFLNVFYSHT